MGKHAPLAPSASSRWLKCQHSYALSRSIPETTNTAAEEGTFAHEIAARALEENRELSDYLGEQTGDFTFDREMLEPLSVYVDAVRAHTPKWRAIEAKVYLGSTRLTYGTSDALILDMRRTLHVYDLKFGDGVFVEVEDNSQLGLYALGALDTFEDVLGDVTDVVLHIVQPRIGENVHRTTRTTVEELRRWERDVMLPATAAAKTSADAYDAGESPVEGFATGAWCKWCPAQNACPAIHEETMALAVQVFEPVVAPTSAQLQTAVSRLTAADLEALLPRLSLVSEWMKLVRDRAHSLLVSGAKIDGYKVVQRWTNRKWRDPVQAEQFLRMLTDAELTALKSPNQIEKQLPKEQRALIASLTERSANGTALAEDNDSRQAFDVTSMFEVLSKP